MSRVVGWDCPQCERVNTVGVDADRVHGVWFYQCPTCGPVEMEEDFYD